MKMQTLRAPLATGTFVQEFEIREVLGSGGFGLVYNAYDTRLQREIALKEYFPAAIAMRNGDGTTVAAQSPRDLGTYSAGLSGFLYEARALARFKQPGLAEIWRFWEQNGTAYIVMPKYFGYTMRACIDRGGESCSEPWLRHILMGVLSALQVLHSKNVFHRDISPENIFVRDNGDPVLLDLGATREATENDSEALTITLKYGYAPIEQYSNDPQIMRQGPWTDIYALCASAYFAITRRPPPTAVGRLINDTLEPLDVEAYPHFSPNFLSAIRAGLEIWPQNRPASAAVLLDALKKRTAVAVPMAAPTVAPPPASVTPKSGTPEASMQAAAGQTAAVAVPPPEAPAFSEDAVVHSTATGSAAAFSTEPSAALQAEEMAEPAGRKARRQESETSAPIPTAPVAALTTRARGVVGGAALAFVLLAVGAWWYDHAQPARDLNVAVVAPTPLAAAVVLPPPVDTAEGTLQPAAPAASVDTAGAVAPALPAAPAAPSGPDTPRPAPAGVPPLAAVTAPAEATADAALRPPVERATLLINVAPWGNVAVDGRDRGVSPPLKRLQLAPGKYVVTVSSPGFTTFTRAIELSADQTVTVSHTFQ